jgi:hypothetical protein
MPWKNELPMEQKQRFINVVQSGRFTVSELRGVRDYAQNRAQVAIEVCRRRDEGIGGESAGAGINY